MNRALRYLWSRSDLIVLAVLVAAAFVSILEQPALPVPSPTTLILAGVAIGACALEVPLLLLGRLRMDPEPDVTPAELARFGARLERLAEDMHRSLQPVARVDVDRELARLEAPE